METEKLDKYMRGKKGVTVRKLGKYTRYLLNDKMFAMSFDLKNRGRVLSLKKNKENKLDCTQFADCIAPSAELEPLHWNDFYLDGGIPDGVLFAAIDESYALILSELPEIVQKMLDPKEPSYKYAFKNFDLVKIMRKNAEKEREE